MSIYKRLYGEIRPHWKLALGGLGFSVLMALAELMPTLLTRYLVDDALAKKNATLLIQLMWAMAALLVIRSLCHYARMVCLGRLAQTILYQIRTNLYEHLQKLSQSFYQNKRTGQIMSRVTNDVNVIEQFVTEGVRDGIVNVLKLLIIAGMLFYMNPWLATITLIPTIPLAWGTNAFSKRVRGGYRTMRRRMADMNSILSDTLAGIRVVQVFGQEEKEATKFRSKSGDFRQAGFLTNHLQAIFYPSVNFAFGIGQILVWALGGLDVVHGTMKLGELIAFSGFVAQFYAPVQVLSQMSNLLANTQASGERIYEILDMQPDIRTEDNAEALPDVRGEVVFEDVTFGYDSSEPTIQDVSLRVSPGEMVGLVGPSGSGKSTLLSLISRFYDPTGGRVLVDGHDVRDVDLADLRKSVSAVLQESYLFHGSIRDNIAYGRPDATFEDVMNAARGANAHDFIMKLPDAYDTHVGERGAKLSGGERQRISIARAILDDPKILILDEATSAVDTESEVQIQQALDNLMEGRTTIAIAHRLSTVRNADQLVVMEDGKIVERGTHDILMQQPDSLYKKLVEMQNKIEAKVPVTVTTNDE